MPGVIEPLPVNEDLLFEVRTPLGWSVRAGRQQWLRISTIKHRTMAGKENEVRQVLRDPEQIRRSRKDAAVYLFYRPLRPGRWICAVAKQVDNGSGFLVTAYSTEAIKQGETVWRR
ncbi:MAG TPA: DUF4258 domain-containing protein [Thermoanaerobaculia bacterium]|nr:DUF4258 domain-containing protein [Thermoanaerobaculia bacterium]